MKSLKPGGLWVDRVGDRGSCAILTQNFWWDEAAPAQTGQKARSWVFSSGLLGAIPEELIPS